MHRPTSSIPIGLACLLLVLLVVAAPTIAAAPNQAATTNQAEDQPEAPQAASIEVTPSELDIEVGGKAELTAIVKDADGNVIEDATVLFFSRARRSVGVTPEGTVEAYTFGDFALIARVPSSPDVDARRDPDALTVEIAVHVPPPPVETVGFVGLPTRYYTGTTLRPELSVVDISGAERSDVKPELTSSAPAVVRISRLGHLELLRAGNAEITVNAEAATNSASIHVVDNPTVSLDLEASAHMARTGDVVHFSATPRDASGNVVAEMPVRFAMQARTVARGLGEPPSGLITDDGRFVADLAGNYTVVAVAGNASASDVVEVEPRDAKHEIELLGQGRVNDRKTSDLWVWEGPDGRDYAITGTWGAAGHAYFWDVTDPRNLQIIDTVKVDARTVNDVKVNEAGTIAIISREGASDRKNGLVIYDVSDMQNKGAQVLARYDDQMTGGVHNVFIYEDHVYALSGGQRYDIINIEDPRNPYRVGRFELDTPGHSIHDVWVTNGVAVSSNWSDGIVLVDVGGGGKGGSPNNPVLMGSYAYPSGRNHAGFPYWSESAGKFYVFAGDEAFPRDRNPIGFDRFVGPPVQAAGWIHVIEFDDLEAPREIARYEVPYGGTHNYWIEDDILYVAYYNAGLRIVDVSGELLGDLYRQGREIAYFLADDPDGFKANARRTWGTMPHKGNIFFADNNSGLWAVRLKPPVTEADDAGGSRN